MKSVKLALMGVLVLVGTAYATQPPDVVTSDSNQNTAMGTDALLGLTTGADNTAAGYGALSGNTGGNSNTAFGASALQYNTTGGGIGSQGTQAATYIAGIYNHSLTGSQVVITSTGEVGVLASSERFKTAIAPMASSSAKIQQLRPVTFHLKTDPKSVLQYGLIAEEVAKVYPELVIRDQSGRIDGVRYDELGPMLLNEIQSQQMTVTAQGVEISALKQQLAVMQAALVKLQAKE